VGSRLLPLVLAAAALAAGAVALFVAISDTLEGRPALLRAVTSGVALALVVVASAARWNAPIGAGASPLATWGLLLALLAYGVPLVAWVLEPMRVPSSTRRPQRRLRPAEVDELLSRAA